jgi:hypothetical protein
MLELLRTVPLFSWLPEEAPEILSGCFDLRIEQGQILNCQGRCGCLLDGTAVFRPEQGSAWVCQPGDLVGIKRDDTGATHAVPGRLESTDHCTVAWFDIALTQTVCYRACWFHVRLLQEINRALDQAGR